MFVFRIIRYFSNPTGLVLVAVLAVTMGCVVGLLVGR